MIPTMINVLLFVAVTCIILMAFDIDAEERSKEK